MHCLTTLLKGSDVLLVAVLGLVDLDLLRSLLQADVGDLVLAVEDLGNLFEGEALGLGEDEVNPDELDTIPKLEACVLV